MQLLSQDSPDWGNTEVQLHTKISDADTVDLLHYVQDPHVNDPLEGQVAGDILGRDLKLLTSQTFPSLANFSTIHISCSLEN